MYNIQALGAKNSPASTCGSLTQKQKNQAANLLSLAELCLLLTKLLRRCYNNT